MAVNFPNGFVVTTNEAIDSRLTMTKAEMLAAKKARMPAVYLTVCKDDGQMYLYNANNEVDSVTGRFRILQANSSSSVLSSATYSKEEVATAISSDEDNILEATDNGLKVSEYGSISTVSINDLFEEN